MFPNLSLILVKLWYSIQVILKISIVFLTKIYSPTNCSAVMDITRLNFGEILPKVKKSIEEATFLTIDCELTGLNVVSNINAFDTVEQYYKKVRRHCKEFLVIQFGICAFRYDKTTNIFKQSSYNFYIFRRPVNRNIPDQRFLCQTSSIDFLISQGFDFNKLFKEGLPYLNLEEETKYQECLEEKYKAALNAATSNDTSKEHKVPIPEDDQPFIDDVMQMIGSYLKSSEKEPLQLPRCNPFLRKLIYQTAGEMYKNKISLSSKQLENRDKVIIASRICSKEELEAIEKQNFDREMGLLDESLGFTKVLRMIVDSGKLVVGHNLMLDMLHTIDKFLTPLPEEYKEFKSCAHSLFPAILDTKFMCNSERFKELINSSVLGHLLESVKLDPFSIPQNEIEDGCMGYSLEDNKEHEAAFDAFITGISFLAMWDYLGRERNLPPEETFGNFNLLKSYLNRIHLMRLQDISHIHLNGGDPNPSRNHVFHLSFPKDWKVSDIQQMFSPFGNVFISWINESSAFVGLYKRDQASMAYSSLSDHETCIVTPFSVYQEKSREASPNHPVRRKNPEKPSDSIKKRKTSNGSPEGEGVVNRKATRRTPKTFAESDTWD